MPKQTERLFHSYPYLSEFQAEILDVRGASPSDASKNDASVGYDILLDCTAFYPESGGQPADTGKLNGHPVSAVFEDGECVWHRVGGMLRAGERVKGVLDWSRRFDHMQQHSGQHLLSQAFVRIKKAETVGFHIGSDCATIDLNAVNLDEKSIGQVEDAANRLVFEARPIRTTTRQADELSDVPLRKRPLLTGLVRVVEIDGYDWSLCCGTHVKQTGEIGTVKILRWENYKGGSRVHFVCGFRALRDYRAKALLVRSVSRILTVGENEIIDLVKKRQEERKASERRIQHLLETVLQTEAEGLLREADSLRSIKLVNRVYHDRKVQEIQMLVRKLVESQGVVAVVGIVDDRTTVFIARSVDVDLDIRPLVQAASEVMQGRGGGSHLWGQVSAENGVNLEEGIKKVLTLVGERL